MFGKAKIQNSNVWKSQNLEFQCSEKQKSRIQFKLQNLQNYISLLSVRGVWIFSGITYNPVNNQVLSAEQ